MADSQMTKRCLLIFNGQIGEDNYLQADKFFKHQGFSTRGIIKRDHIDDLKNRVCEEVKNHKSITFWVCCVMGPGSHNIFLLDKPATSKTGDHQNLVVSYLKLEEWFKDNRSSTNSKVVFMFDMNHTQIPRYVSDGPTAVQSIDANIMTFISYTNWGGSKGHSPCMQHFCRPGTLTSFHDWCETTKKRMVEDGLRSVPTISRRGSDRFLIP